MALCSFYYPVKKIKRVRISPKKIQICVFFILVLFDCGEWSTSGIKDTQ